VPIAQLHVLILSHCSTVHSHYNFRRNKIHYHTHLLLLRFMSIICETRQEAYILTNFEEKDRESEQAK